MATFSFRQRTRTNKDGTASIILRVMHRSEKKDLTLKISAVPGNFDNVKQRFLRKQEGWAKKNGLLVDLLVRCRKIEEDLQLREGFTMEEFTYRYKKKKKKSDKEFTIVQYYSDIIDDLDNRVDSPGNSRKYKDTLNSLKKFQESLEGKKVVYFSDLTPNVVNDYIYWMRDHTDSGAVTRETRFSNLRAAYNRAKDDKLIKDHEYPFKKIDRKQLKKKSDGQAYEYLSREEWIRFKEFDRPTIINGRDVDTLAWDLFRLSVYCAGLNVADMVRLRDRHIQMTEAGPALIYTRAKTEKQIELYLEDEALKIFDKYKKERSHDFLLPLSRIKNPGEKYYFNKRKKHSREFNAALVRITEKLKIDKKITFYCARHTFATLLHHHGVSSIKISAALGHTSESQTKRYLANLGIRGLKSIIKDIL